MEPKYKKRFVSVIIDTPIIHWRSVSQDSGGAGWRLKHFWVDRIFGWPSKHRGTQMDGENDGTPYEQMEWMIWGGFTTPIFGSTPISSH